MAVPDFGIDLAAVRDRLAAITEFLSVTDLQDAAQAIGDINFLPPAAFVYIADESFEPNRYATQVTAQRANVTLGVLFCVHEERADNATRDEVDFMGKAIIKRLIAWTPPGATKPLNPVSRRPRMIEAGLIWTEVLFRTAYDLTATGPEA